MPFRYLRVLVVAVLLAGVSGAVSASAGALRDAIEARRARAAAAVSGDGARESSTAAIPAGARVLRDLAYGPDPQQRLDAYLPPSAATPGAAAPIVLMVHGGGWTRGDKAMGRVVSNKVARWAPMGALVVSVNYRMDASAPDPLEQADDVARSLAYVQREAPKWGGDAGRVLLMGHSAGAHLVALLAADRAIAQRQGAGPWLGTVALDSAAYDVVAIMSARHARLYDRAFGGDPERWREASPLHRLAEAPAPLLLVCSARRADACPQADAFAAQARAHGGVADVLREDRSHGEINADLGEPGAYTDAVEAFMRRVGALP